MKMWYAFGAIALLLIGCAAPAQVYLSQSDFNSSIQPGPTASGDVQAEAEVVSDGETSVHPVANLGAPVTIAIYTSSLPPAGTDVPGLTVYRARAVSGYQNTFPGSMTLTMTYSEQDFNGPEANVRLFRYDALNNLWVSVLFSLDTVANTVTTTITAPGLFGLAHTSPFGIPTLGEWGLIALGLGLLAAGTLAVRRGGWRVGLAPIIGLALVSALLLLSGPSVEARHVLQTINTDGAKAPLKHFDKLSIEGPVGAEMVYTAKSQFWKYPAVAADQPDPAKWEKSPWNPTFPKTFTEKPPAAAQGAPVKVRNYDINKDPFFNCATFAFRGELMYFLVDASDWSNTLTKEYDDKGAPGDGGYMVDDVLTYKKDGLLTHFAKVTAVDGAGKITALRSKWGDGFLMDHKIKEVLASYGDADRVYRLKNPLLLSSPGSSDSEEGRPSHAAPRNH